MEILLLRGILLVFCALFNLILAFLLFGKRRESKAVFHLGLTALFSATFCFTCAMADFSWKDSFSYSVKLFWNKSTWLGVLILPAYLIFVYYFTNKTKYIKLKSFLWYLGGGTISFLALTTPYFVESIQIESSDIFAMPGKLEPLGRLYIVFAIVVGLIYILREYSQSKRFRKLQLKYFVLGITIYSLGGIIFTGTLPLFQRSTGPYVDATALLSCFWVGLTSYAIVRYRLMDIRVALGKGVAFILSFLTALLAGFLLIFINSQLPTPLGLFQLLPLILLFAFGLLQLSKFYEGLAEVYFYPGFFKRKIIIENLEEELTCLLEMETFSFLIAQTLKRAFDLERIAVLTRISRKEYFNPQKLIGYEEKELSNLSKDKTLISLLRKFKKPFGAQEISAILPKIKDKEKVTSLEKLKEKIEGLEIGLLVPLLFERKVVGIIVLGQELEKEAFSKEDIELLTTLSRQASVALRNTLLYSEIKKRKEELERFYRLTVGRELKMFELKKKILELEEKLKKEK